MTASRFTSRSRTRSRLALHGEGGVALFLLSTGDAARRLAIGCSTPCVRALWSRIIAVAGLVRDGLRAAARSPGAHIDRQSPLPPYSRVAILLVRKVRPFKTPSRGASAAPQ